MLTNTTLRAQVDALWDKLWSGGLSNPLDAIEQLSFLLFLKRLDEREDAAARQAQRRGTKPESLFPAGKDGQQLRWSYWSALSAADALKHVKEKVFPWIKTLGGAGGSFAAQMENAEFKINKPALLIEACRAIDAMQVSAQNQDVQGDLYEYLLSKLNTAGTNGQFRTPRHIIRMMVKMVDPRPRERIVDPAAGTCGFLVNAWQHLLETHTDPRDLTIDEEGFPHGLTGARLDPVIAGHCKEIVSADGIIIVHPNWWGMPPAILKGWIDRVLRMEVAYRFVADDKGEGVPVGLLKAKAAIVFNTANTPDDRERTVFGDPLETLWKKCVFDLCGVKNVQRRTFSVVVTSTPEQRAQWLAEVRKIVSVHFPSAKN